MIVKIKSHVWKISERKTMSSLHILTAEQVSASQRFYMVLLSYSHMV